MILLKKLKSSPLFWLLAISAIVRLFFYAALQNTIAVDSASYMNYHANILKGESEALRTPLYPYFIKLIGLFGQRDLIGHIIVAQIIISFLTIIPFYKITQALLKAPAIIFASSLLYGVMLPVINFDKLILTESLSISFVVLFVYLMVSCLQKPNTLKACLLALLVLLAVMLRPSFIYLVPLVILFWIMKLAIDKENRIAFFWGIGSSAIVILLLVGYSHLNEKKYGFNGISVVSNNNQMAEIVNANIYSYGNDPEISSAIAFNLHLELANPGKHIPGINIMKKYNPDRVHAFIKTCIKNKPGIYSAYMANKLIKLQADNIFTCYAWYKTNWLSSVAGHAERLFVMNFAVLYGIVLIILVLIIIQWIKTKNTPLLKLFLWLIVMGQLAVAIIGGYSEYQRLILPVIPVLIVLLANYADGVYVYKHKFVS